jgi:hypothetical protein
VKNKLIIVDKYISIDVEKYIEFENIYKARLLTKKIFLNNKGFVKTHTYKGYEISWGLYDAIYKFCLLFTQLEKLINYIEKGGYSEIDVTHLDLKFANVISIYFYDKKITNRLIKRSLYSNIKSFILNFILLIFTLISIIYFFIRKRKYVGIWTGDFIFKKTTSDFRLNHLYERLQDRNTPYIEFIRTHNFKNFILNTWKRKRMAVYYSSILYFIKIFNKTKYRKPNNFYESVMFKFESPINNAIPVIYILSKIMKILDIKVNISFAFSSRSMHFHLASKILGIKTIGIMHGISQRNYLVNEFIEEYSGSKMIGPDIFGVWSEYMMEYYKKYCKIIPLNKIYLSGMLRNSQYNYLYKNEKFKLIEGGKIRVLLISEPLVEASEILPYVKELYKSNNIKLAIKLRPMVNDSFYSELVNLYPDIKNIDVYNGDILEVGSNFDVFLGSHSTAVIEASLIGKISFFVKTMKWGDFFSQNTLVHGVELICDDHNNIVKDIVNRIKYEDKFNTRVKNRKRYFGKMQDGSQWIANEVNKIIG